MKRFYVTAAIAASLLATGCQKTYVIDEVRTPIGFSTEVGKQTKAIIKSGTDYNDQDFGVFAYGVVGTSDENHNVIDGKWSNNFAINNDNTVMDNVKISKQTADPSYVWKANDGKTYYWPNDSKTTLSFFAYSPYSKANSSENAADAVGMGITPTFTAANGIQLTNYVHNDYKGDKAVDFMVAETLNQKYTGTDKTNNGEVGIQFAHRMSQINFKVAKATGLNGITMKLQSFEMLSINNKADYTDKVTSDETTAPQWVCATGSTANYPVFQYSSTEPIVAEMVIDETCKLDPVTMIPQTLVGGNTPQQQVKIVYTISGSGLANETVTKTFMLHTDGLSSWGINQKITYKITIGMNQITFKPTVADWAEYDSIDDNEDPKDPVDIAI